MRIVLLVLVALMFCPASSSAATVSVHVMAMERNTFSNLTFTATPGEANDVTVTYGNGSVLVRDTGARIEAGENCQSISPLEARCYPARDLGFRLGDGDDRIDLAITPGANADGGPGDDMLIGGPGADTLRGGDGRDTIDGRGGSDSVLGDDATPFTDRLSGGSDSSYFGNQDGVDYGGRARAVTIDLARGTAGEPGENDTIDGFENARGGTTSEDTVLGDDGENALSGYRVVGRGGNDRLAGIEVNGGEGDDQIESRGNATIGCGPGLDVVINSSLGTQPAALLLPSCELWRMFQGDFHNALVRITPTVERGQVVIRFHCPDEESEAGRCDGTLRLERTDQHDRVIGRARFRVPGRHTRKIRVPVAPRDLRAVRDPDGLPLRVRMRVDHTTDPQDFSYLGTYRTVLLARAPSEPERSCARSRGSAVQTTLRRTCQPL
jgi:hypothetical protein